MMSSASVRTQVPTAGVGDRYRFGLLLVAACCAVAGCLALTIDVPVARWCKRWPPPLPGDVLRFLNFVEAFAHGMGQAAIVATLVACDAALALPLPGRPAGARSNVLRIVGATAAGGFLVNLLKSGVERVRPRAADLAGIDSVFATFDPAVMLRAMADDTALLSFPSGHAAAAAGFAAALGWKYPRGRIAFATLALLAATQRVVTTAHYPSDVCFGAAIGVAAAALILGGRPPWPQSVAAGSTT